MTAIRNIQYNCLNMDVGIEIADTCCKSPNWQVSNRMIFIRPFLPTRPKAP